MIDYKVNLLFTDLRVMTGSDQVHYRTDTTVNYVKCAVIGQANVKQDLD